MATGEGRKDAATARLSGRAPDNRLVHFAVPEGAEVPRPGDVATVQVTYGAPHHLVADGGLAGGPYAVRRTRAGDAWQRASSSGLTRPRRPPCRSDSRDGDPTLPVAGPAPATASG